MRHDSSWVFECPRCHAPALLARALLAAVARGLRRSRRRPGRSSANGTRSIEAAEEGKENKKNFAPKSKRCFFCNLIDCGV